MFASAYSHYYAAVLLVIGSWVVVKLIQSVRMCVKTTKLNGPPSTSLIFGVTRDLFKGDSGLLHEEWAKEYGTVYQIPTPFGGQTIVLTDPRAIAHFYSKETFTYVQSTFSKSITESVVSWIAQHY